MTLDEMKEKLNKALFPKRFRHSVNVMDTAIKLAGIYNEDTGRALIAGLLHDCARDIRGNDIFIMCERFGIEINNVTKSQPELLHGPIGAEIAASDYGIDDSAVLNAIRWHTTGCEDMSMLDKIIYIADYIEPGRTFPGVNEVRELAFRDINAAMVASLDRTIKFVIGKGALIHPYTISARNSIIIRDIQKDEKSL